MIYFGLKENILAVSYLDGSFSKYEDELKSLEILSDSWPSKEGIMNLNPKIIYSMESAFREDIIGEIDYWKGMGIEALSVVDYNKGISKENYYEDLKSFGKVYGKEEEVDKYIRELEDHIKELREKNKVESVEKVLFIGGAGRGNYDFYPRNWCILDEIVEDLGGEFMDLSDKYMELSIEAIVKANPDKIIITEFKENNREKIISELKEKPLLKDLKAIKNKEILVVDYTTSIRGGVNLKETYTEVSEFLAGEDRK